MFRDFKIGGYNLESTNASGQRLLTDFNHNTCLYWATIQGEKSNEWAYKIRRAWKVIAHDDDTVVSTLAYIARVG